MHIKFQLIRLFHVFIWWCETTEGFIDSHFDVKVSNVFSVAMGLIILILLGAALPLVVIILMICFRFRKTPSDTTGSVIHILQKKQPGKMLKVLVQLKVEIWQLLQTGTC